MRGARPDRLAAGVIARHFHARPYATIVLEGGYEEAGDHDRFRVASRSLLAPIVAHGVGDMVEVGLAILWRAAA